MNVILILSVMVGAVLVTAAFLRGFPVVASAVFQDDTKDRYASMDGLRGILAFSVFIHHSILAHNFARTGVQGSSSNFETLIGRASVALFFMITAYLFWGRVLRREGRLDWPAFFRGRMLRLLPLYIFAVLTLFFVIAVDSDFTLRVPVIDLIKQGAAWFAFSALGFPDINRVEHTAKILSLIYTLKYEWVFYFALPLGALIYRFFKRSWPIYAAVFLISLLGPAWSFFGFFVGGAVAIHLVDAKYPNAKILWPTLGIFGLITLDFFFHDILGPIQALLLLPVFIAAMRAEGPWAILRWRPLRFLGHISYSVYLMQGLLIHMLVGWVIGTSVYGSLDSLQFYGVVLLMGIALIAISTITFLVIERPLMKFGEIRKVRAQATQNASSENALPRLE